MNDDREIKWPAILFFLTSGLFFFGCVLYLYAGTTNPEFYWSQTGPACDARAKSGLATNERLLLKKNRAMRVDDSVIIYRGTQDGALVMDLFILALDPHYGYAHRIDEKSAQRGFSIGGYHFRALAVSDDRISLKHL